MEGTNLITKPMENKSITPSTLENHNLTSTMNVLALKEKKGIMKKLWDKMIDFNVKKQKVTIKRTPMTCKVLSVFIPEAAPMLLSIKDFCETDSGKKLAEISCRSYDSLGELLKGNKEEAKSEFSDCLRLFSADDAGKIALDVRNLIGEVKGMAK